MNIMLKKNLIVIVFIVLLVFLGLMIIGKQSGVLKFDSDKISTLHSVTDNMNIVSKSESKQGKYRKVIWKYSGIKSDSVKIVNNYKDKLIEDGFFNFGQVDTDKLSYLLAKESEDEGYVIYVKIECYKQQSGITVSYEKLVGTYGTNNSSLK